VDLFQISERDRRFLLSLVDLAQGYQEEQRSPGDPDTNQGV
jgi:hypothetical protein